MGKIPTTALWRPPIVIFSGKSESTIDAKSRLAIPSKFRSLMDEATDGKAWYCVAWPGEGLRLYTEKRFQLLGDQGEQSLAPSEDSARLERDLFSEFERLDMDGQGRITIPKAMLDDAGLGPEVMVLGARNRLEVIDRSKWQADRPARRESLPTLVRSVEATRRALGG